MTEKPNDTHIWAAFDASKREVQRWEIITAFERSAALAVRYPPRTPPPTPLESVLPTDVAFERHEFKGEAEARNYILWRSIKAALETYEKIRS